MPVSPNPTPPIVLAFELPAAERLQAIRALLDGGADPNTQDRRLNRFESVLGRACRYPYPVRTGESREIDLAVIQELLDRGANPLRATIWGEETGEMGGLFNRIAFQAWDNTAPPSANPFASQVKQDPSDPAPAIMRALLQACLAHDHRDDKFHNAVSHMLMELRHYSHKHYLEPIRTALEIGFNPSQSISNSPTPVHYMIDRYAADNTLAGNAWAWSFIELFVDAGADMSKQDHEGRSGWDAVDACASASGHVPAFRSIQAKRQADKLEEETTAHQASRPTRRI